MASHTTSLRNFGLRLGLTRLFGLLLFPAQSQVGKVGGQTAPRRRQEPPGKAKMLRASAGPRRQHWCQQGFLHPPSARGALAPAGSPSGGNRWLSQGSCHRRQVCSGPLSPPGIIPSINILNCWVFMSQEGYSQPGAECHRRCLMPEVPLPPGPEQPEIWAQWGAAWW